MTESPKITARKIICDGKKVVERFAAQGVTTIEQIAFKVGRDPKTIQAMIAEKGNYRSVVEDVANVLGVDVDEIRKPEVTTDPEPNRKSRTVIIKVSEAALQDTDSLTIIVEISRDARTIGDMVVEDEKTESILITVEMTEEDAIRVAQAFLTGKLARYCIQSVTFLTPDDLESGPTERDQSPQPMRRETPTRFFPLFSEASDLWGLCYDY